MDTEQSILLLSVKKFKYVAVMGRKYKFIAIMVKKKIKRTFLLLIKSISMLLLWINDKVHCFYW